MKAVIVEDEIFASRTLEDLIQETAPEIEIVSVLQSIDDCVEWFHLHPMPDLIFMDIHLADGSSFTVFDEVNITCPVIFTTAYDEYALKAFEVNSIDYLLKPIGKKDMERALAKYKNLSAGSSAVNADIIRKLTESFKQNERKYKSYFLVSEKDKLVPLAVADIAYIYIDAKMVKAITFAGTTRYLDQTLDEVTMLLNPDDFFRANRQFIVARKAIKDLSIWFGGKISVNLTVSVPERIVVSKARAADAKKWITD